MKALGKGRHGVFRLARVGNWVLACAFVILVNRTKNEPVDDAKAAGKSTADFPQITADIFTALTIDRETYLPIIFKNEEPYP